MSRTRASSVLAAAAFLAAALIAVPATPASAAAPTDGLLAAQLRFVNPDSSTTSMPSRLWGAKEFSPDGSKLAGAVQTSTLQVWSSDGSETEVATMPSDIDGYAWSPDQTQLAVLVRKGNFDAQIYRVPVAANATPVLLVDSTSGFAVEGGWNSQISWSPTGNKVAFIGTERDADGSALSVHARQIYTVPAFGGAASTRYNQHQPEECELVCTYYEYENPAWTPRGDGIAALVTQHVEDNSSADSLWTDEQYVGIATSEEPGATKVRRLSIYNQTVDSYSHLGSGPLVYSADGTRIMISVAATELGERRPTIVDGTTGAVIKTYTSQFVWTDWQPCPSGTCAVWTLPPKIPTALKGRLPGTSWKAKSPPSAIGELNVGPPAGNATGSIRLIIDGKLVKSARLTAAMKNRFSFKLPVLKKGKHTVQLQYGGSSKYMPSSTGVAKVTSK